MGIQPQGEDLRKAVKWVSEERKFNPNKDVLVPRIAGCSLADSITGDQVRELRDKHPDAGVVCYVNSYAEVKAEKILNRDGSFFLEKLHGNGAFGGFEGNGGIVYF